MEQLAIITGYIMMFILLTSVTLIAVCMVTIIVTSVYKEALRSYRSHVRDF
jgi:hypothetical protein